MPRGCNCGEKERQWARNEDEHRNAGDMGVCLYNVEHPDDGAEWQARAQVQLMFPK